ncbi:hypothetical protein [Pedobacter namyangjuensis]|uniref:hypothetical protein n=1 Tax=Pedobacter namyangjuensis TaxID=600626 RepID=UPI000DE2F513|nr:hypothetical protein [Pedobacter namyangjuensis]
MEKDKLKSIWKTIPIQHKSDIELTKMLKEQNHPVLNAIKKQAFFELFAFASFLVCYYTMFDGAKKSSLANLALVFAISINMLHHLKGYRLQQIFRASENVLEDLKRFAVKLKSYQLETLIAKIVFIAGMGIFFTNGIQLTANKWWAIGLIVIIFTMQLIFLNSVWVNRIRKIKTTLMEFENA